MKSVLKSVLISVLESVFRSVLESMLQSVLEYEYPWERCILFKGLGLNLEARVLVHTLVHFLQRVQWCFNVILGDIEINTILLCNNN